MYHKGKKLSRRQSRNAWNKNAGYTHRSNKTRDEFKYGGRRR